MPLILSNIKRTGYWLGKKLSEEHKRKIGEASAGKKHTKEAKEKIGNALRGRRHTEERIRKNSEAHKGKNMSEETKRKIGIALEGRKVIFSEEHKRKCRELRLIFNKNWKGKKHSQETKNKISMAHMGMKKPWVIHPDNKGEKNANWQGGKSFELYSREWTDSLKLFVRQRDGDTCKVCGSIHKGNIAYDVHHIDYNKKNNSPTNLITLCHKCHLRTNWNREKWVKYFKK